VETEFYGFLTNLLNAPTMVGLGLLMLAAYFWFTKITSERTVGSEFKELIGQLQSQITELHDQLKEERIVPGSHICRNDIRSVSRRGYRTDI
jgi:hypothetical protein